MDFNTLMTQYPKKVKAGNLKYLNLDCPDIDQMFLRKASQFFNRHAKNFQLYYYPEIHDYDILFVSEDVTPGKRELVKRASAKGVKTAVIQHGFPCHVHGYAPLTADYLLSWPETVDIFVQWGISRDRIIPFSPEPPRQLRKIEGVEAVLFLVLPKNLHYRSEPIVRTYTEEEIMQIVEAISRQEPKLLIKPHLKFWDKWKHRLGAYNIVWDNAYDLIYSAERVYSFSYCTTKKDCELLGKTPILADQFLGVIRLDWECKPMAR